jgi:sortase A
MSAVRVPASLRGEQVGPRLPWLVVWVARALAAIGRSMITIGVLLLLFVAYQLWGTGIRTAQAQNDLEDRFAERLESYNSAVVTTSSTTSTTLDPAVTTTSRLPATTAPPLPPELLPAQGEVAGRIVMPTIGVDWWFVEGVSVADLKKGPGHYPESPFPGQAGNAAIAGHRTTYGAPFGDVDQLQPGDEIQIATLQGEFTYLVRETIIVNPSDVHVLNEDFWDFDRDGSPEPNVLTLTACHPKYSARQRIIIGAELVGDPAPATPRVAHGPDGPAELPAETPTSFEESNLSGDRASARPAVLWGLLCASLWLFAWALGKQWRRVKWPAYFVLVGPFLAALYFFFEDVSRLLPANY